VNPENQEVAIVAVDIISRMGVLDEHTCVELIQSTPIGRVGFISDNKPLVLPVNFAWFEGGVVFRSLDGQKLSAAVDKQHVCFEIDRWEQASHKGWSVVVQGQAHHVTDWAEIEHLENLGLVPWATEAWRQMWIRIEPQTISGRQIR